MLCFDFLFDFREPLGNVCAWCGNGELFFDCFVFAVVEDDADFDLVKL